MCTCDYLGTAYSWLAGDSLRAGAASGLLTRELRASPRGCPIIICIKRMSFSSMKLKDLRFHSKCLRGLLSI